MPNLGDGSELGSTRSGKKKSRSEFGKSKSRSPDHVRARNPDFEPRHVTPYFPFAVGGTCSRFLPECLAEPSGVVRFMLAISPSYPS